ncbi:hypothetical protein M438DRAFT_166593 [Aureobasidium pullulans EXF-150]|uniref:Uncharacterized protein n=1 Tax=Aureobasidium pullulans EXF-150 TaxID=1043002 RepID=A0A074YK84_AURPU|nr:uncharacterized protein M438DRAFT_166593 [Aureobasidium pullulans EXF-150]KEQ87306.1 hypothetical protein M438DRAFT_166593 [Aureobasidium pullulans EXF-150]
MSASSPYTESDIIALITQYYHLLFQLHYISPSSVSFPPPTGRILNLQLCHSLYLTPAVISLMQHLPCPRDEGIMLEHDIFIPGSFANSFVNDRFIKLGRDPEIGERDNFLKSTDIALSIMGDEGSFIVLDTEKNTIRVCDFNGPVDEEDDVDGGKELRYDFDPACPSDHYTRFPVRDPVVFLQGCIDKIKRLEWIPRKIHGMGVISTGGIEYERLKKILIEEYGWPNDFKQEAWEKDCERFGVIINA